MTTMVLGHISSQFCSRPAALYFTATSLLTVMLLLKQDSHRRGDGGGGQQMYLQKSENTLKNDPKCEELGWICVPLAVEAYGAWGIEAQCIISCLARKFCIRMSQTMSTWMYGRLNMTLRPTQDLCME